MDEIPSHIITALFEHFGSDHALVESAYRREIDRVIERLESQLPIDLGHGIVANSADDLPNMLAAVHPFNGSREGDAETGRRLRGQLIRLAYDE